MNQFKPVLLILLLVLGAAALTAQTIEIPGVGAVGFEKINSTTYSVSIPNLGTYDFEGHYNSPSDFDLAATLPIGDFTDYIPGIGQLLGVLGLDSVEYRIKQTGLGLKIHLESGGLGFLRGTVTEALSEVDVLRVAIDGIISVLELETLDLTGQVMDGKLIGKVQGVISLATAEIGFNTGEGELSVSAIVDSIVDSVLPAAMDFVGDLVEAAYDAVADAAEEAADFAMDAAEDLIREVGVIAHDVSTSVSHGSHSFSKCYNDCTRNYANSQRNPMLEGSNRVFQEFYNRVYRDIRKINGVDANDTRVKRNNLIYADWNNLVTTFDNKWAGIRNDDEVENYFFKSSSERRARDRYRGMIDESWGQNRAFRDGLYSRLMTMTAPVRLTRTSQEALSMLATAAKTGRAVQFLHTDTDVAWDLSWNNDTVSERDGANITYWDKHHGANQMWYLVPTRVQDTYHIQSAATGKFIHIGNANDRSGSNILTWDGYGAPQTTFRAFADNNGYITWMTENGNAFDLAGGNPVTGTNLQIWTPNHSSAQKVYLDFPTEQPVLKPGLYRIRSAGRGSHYLITDPVERDGVNAMLYSENDHIGQTWYIRGAHYRDGKITYSLFNLGSNRYVHTEGARFDRGTNLLGWSGVGGENTSYFFLPQDDGTFVLQALGGQVFDVEGGGDAAGNHTNVRLWDYNGNSGQKWYLEPVEEDPAAVLADRHAGWAAKEDLQNWAADGKAIYISLMDHDLVCDVAWGDEAVQGRDGVNVGFYTRHHGTNQLWYPVPAGSRDTYYFQSAATGKFLHIKDDQDRAGTSLEITDGSSSPGTAFRIYGEKDGSLIFQTQNGNLLAMEGKIPESGRDLLLKNARSNENIRFHLSLPLVQPEVKAGLYRIRSAGAGRHYLITDPSEMNGVNVMLYQQNNHIGQTWFIQGSYSMEGRNTFSLYNRGSHRYIHTENARFDQGTNLLGWSGVGGENTAYCFLLQEDGSYVIQAKGGRVFDVAGGGHMAGNNVNVMLWDYNGGSGQKWFLEPVR